jgi:hypothetical protein
VRTEVRNQIQMLGHAVAAEVPGKPDSHRRWLRLGPSTDGISLLEVEGPAGEDPTKHAKREGDYMVVSEETFSSLDVAIATLEGRGVDTGPFDAIWKSDNPF